MADSLVKAESPLLQEILADIKAAMKAHDSVTLEVLRTLHSDIKNVAINAKKDVTDDIVLDVLAKSIKQRNESIEMLRKGGREENAQEEEKTLAVYQKYLPKQLSSSPMGASNLWSMRPVLGFISCPVLNMVYSQTFSPVSR